MAKKVTKAKKVAPSKKVVKKAPAKKTSNPPQKKGLLTFLFGSKKEKKPSPKKKAPPSKSSISKNSASLKKVITKTPDKKQTPLATSKTLEKKKEPTAPVTKVLIPPKAVRVEPVKEFIVKCSYTPEPFKGSHFLLKPNKQLTAEGWKRLFQEKE